MRARKIILLLFVLCSGNLAMTQQVWTIGPMYHFNFGNGKARGSFAIEFAYWNVKHFPWSIDGGIEFEKGCFRMYSEMQTGIIVAGLSCGPVLEFNSEKNKVGLGLQGSFWANYYIGLDYRVRKVNGTSRYSFGTYIKLPMARSGFEESDHGSLDHIDWD